VIDCHNARWKPETTRTVFALLNTHKRMSVIFVIDGITTRCEVWRHYVCR